MSESVKTSFKQFLTMYSSSIFVKSKNKVLKKFLYIFIIYTQLNFSQCEPFISKYWNDTIEVRWDSNLEQLNGYEISSKNSSSIFSENNTDIKSEIYSIYYDNFTSPINITNLTPGRKYQKSFKVKLPNNDYKEYEPSYFTTKPNEPSNIVCEQIYKIIDIEWKRPRNTFFSHYQIYLFGENLKTGSIEQITKFTKPLNSKYLKVPKSKFGTNHKSLSLTISTISGDKLSEPLYAKCHQDESPTNVRVETKTLRSYSFLIQWDPPKSDFEFDHYVVCIDNYNISKNVSASSPRVVGFNDSIIQPGNTYKIHVLTITGNYKASSEMINVFTPPLPVINLYVLPGNNSDIFVSWNVKEESKQHNFTVRYKRIDTGKISTRVVNETHTNLTSLMAGSLYLIEVIAMYEHVASYSRFKNQSTYPLMPYFDDIDESSHPSLMISWKFNKTLSMKDFYLIKWNRFDINKTDEKLIDEDVNKVKIEDFHPGAKYLIQIYAVSNRLYSKPSVRHFTMRPFPPYDLEYSYSNGSCLNLTWKEPKGSLFEYFIVKLLNSKGVNMKEEIVHGTWLYIDDISTMKVSTIKIYTMSNGKASDEFRDYLELNQDDNIEFDQEAFDKDENYFSLLFGLFSIIIIGSCITIFLIIKYRKTLCKNITKNNMTGEFENIHLPMLKQKQIGKENILADLDDSLKIDFNELKVQYENRLGDGQFGEVYYGQLNLKSGRITTIVPVAIKKLKISSNQSDLKNFLREAIIMKNFSHNNVLALFGISCESDGSPLIILPFMDNKDLLSYLRNENNGPRVRDLIQFGIDVAKGMHYLSEHHFVHRDLAARNCMLDSNLCIKVADFGFARYTYSKNYYRAQKRNQLLPIKWMAIESIEKDLYNNKTDVWAYGVLMWEILTRGVTPYPGLDSAQVIVFLNQGHRLEKPDYCPSSVYQIMLLCWSSNQDKRPTFENMAQDLGNVLNHPNEFMKNKHNYYNDPILISKKMRESFHE